MSHCAAKFALELNVILSVLRAVLDWNLAAVRANQLLRFEICLSIVHCILTSLTTTEVWLFAFETLIIREYR